MTALKPQQARPRWRESCCKAIRTSLSSQSGLRWNATTSDLTPTCPSSSPRHDPATQHSFPHAPKSTSTANSPFHRKRRCATCTCQGYTAQLENPVEHKWEGSGRRHVLTFVRSLHSSAQAAQPPPRVRAQWYKEAMVNIWVRASPTHCARGQQWTLWAPGTGVFGGVRDGIRPL